MRVALFQYDINPDPEINLDEIAQAATEACEQQADVLILPEVCLTGFGAGPRAPVAAQGGPEEQRLMELSQTHELGILAGLRYEGDSLPRNRAILYAEGRAVGYCDKSILFSYWREETVMERGVGERLIPFRGWHLAPVICYELRFPELFRSVLGAAVFPVLANWPASRRDHWLTLLRARAIENQAYVIGVNRIGESAGIAFSGDSVVFDPRGECILDMQSSSGVSCVDLDRAALDAYREEFPVLKDALLT